MHDLVQALVMTCTRSSEKTLWKSRSSPPTEALHQDLEDALRNLVQVLSRGSCENPGGILSKRFSHEDLAGAMSSRCLYESSCGSSWEVLVSRSCKFRSSSRAFFDDLVSFVLLGCSQEVLV